MKPPTRHGHLIMSWWWTCAIAALPTGCLDCPDLSEPDSAAYTIYMAEESLTDTGFGTERPDLLGGLIVEEGDSLRVLYHRSTGELVEVTYRRIPEGETGP